jgi:hypothetical protein
MVKVIIKINLKTWVIIKQAKTLIKILQDKIFIRILDHNRILSLIP